MSMRNRIERVDGYMDLNDEYRKPGYIEYVLIFDRFFTFIEMIFRYLQTNIIELRHIIEVLYILGRLDKIRIDGEPIFDGYLVHYQYESVIYLIELAKISLPNADRPFLNRRAKMATTKRIDHISRQLEQEH